MLHQSDTFHAIAHRFGLYVERFEKAGFGAIGALYESERLVIAAKRLVHGTNV